MKRVGAALVASFVVHGVLAASMGRLPTRRLTPAPQVTVTVDYVPPPEPPKPPPPPPPAPRPPVKMTRPPPKPVAKAALPPPRIPQQPLAAPPPPTVEAKEPTPQPLVVTGITLESTTSSGSIGVAVGNTLGGDPGRKAHEPVAASKPYKAEKYATSAQLNELPAVLNRDALDIRRFYPPLALKKEVEGDVVLRLLIDSDGSIARVEIISDPGEGLGPAAARAVRELRFRPGKVNGEAVATTIPFTIRFVIN